MRAEFASLLLEARPALSSCSVCPVKGSCVYATPEYEPGFCLHEYRLLHAYVASRLRAHPPAGAAGFARLADDIHSVAETICGQRTAAGHASLPPEGTVPWMARTAQASPGRFGLGAA